MDASLRNFFAVVVASLLPRGKAVDHEQPAWYDDFDPTRRKRVFVVFRNALPERLVRKAIHRQAASAAPHIVWQEGHEDQRA